MNSNLYVILMAGGAGTRFWPYSRKANPKQFLDVLGTGKTLIQSAYERFLPLCPPENIFVVTTKELAELAKTQLKITDKQVIKEPAGKNTAPCIAYSCYKIRKQSPNAVVVISPADHLILNEIEFQHTIAQVVEHAVGQDRLITLGVNPTRPETGYGYIKFIASEHTLKKVETFIEKPAIEKAKKFIEHGGFVWNSGIFIWSVSAIITAIQTHQPKIAVAFESLSDAFYTQKEEEAVQKIYAEIESISIDYGIMEKADNVFVWLCNFAWSDLGSWSSLHTLQKKDDHGNVIDANTMVYDTHNSIIKGSKDKLIVAQGLSGYLVGEFGNVFVVCKKDQAFLFRKFIADLKDNPENDIYL